jgi:glycosyltransferase involved in cell wall biosynthesis
LKTAVVQAPAERERSQGIQTMRVAIVARTAKRRGGTETYLFDLVRGFTAAGHAVDVFAASDSWRSAARAAGAAVLVYPIALVPASIRPWAFRAALGVSFRRDRYDLTISLARVNGHDLAICGGTHRGFLQATGQRPSWRDRSEIALEERCYRESAVNVAHSRRMGRELIELYGVSPDRLRVVYPPVDTSVYRPATPDIRQALKRRFGFSPRRTTLLFPSNSHDRKGLPLLLDALAGLPADDYELVVAGSKADSHESPANVRYLGFVGAMVELYQAADATVLPARYEPFGLVVPESIASGTPVITAAHVGASEVMTPATGIVLGELSVETLRAAIAAARETRFEIPRDFVREQGLDLAGHVRRLIEARPDVRRCA